MAIIQPFDVEDAAVSEICAKVEGIPQIETRRLLRLLVDAGVLFRRGGAYRLSPDLLADYIIESECIDCNGASTGYAEQIFDAANHRLLEHIVLNVGRLDWRRSNGNPSNSRLMDEIWRKLRPEQEYGDPHLRAVKAVAYYQPRYALRFVEDLMCRGEYLHDLPEITKFVAYNMEYLTEACECLWELGKNDSRPTHRHPEHGIRILAALAAVERNKPFEFNESVVDFALSLFERPDSWTIVHSPLEILRGIVQTEGHSTMSNGGTISFLPYQVRPEFVQPLLDKVRNAVVGLLSGPNLKIAIHAAAFVQEMIRYPMGLFNSKVPDDTYEAWTKEFARTFVAIRDAIRAFPLDSLVLLELARSVSWHANYSGRGTRELATDILACLPNHLEFRTLIALADPFGRIFDRPRKTNDNTDWAKQAKLVAEDLLIALPGGETLRATIEGHMTHIASAGMKAEPFTLYWELLQRSRLLADATIEKALADANSLTNRFAAAALEIVLREDENAALDISYRFLNSGVDDLACAVGAAHGLFDFSKDNQKRSHLVLVKELLSSNNDAIVRSAIRAVAQVAEHDKRMALDLILGTEFGRSEFDSKLMTRARAFG